MQAITPATVPPRAPERLLNMSTGPVEVSPAVLDAQLAGLLSPHHRDFWALHDEVVTRLQRALCTTGRVVMTHGSIRTGIDLALGNILRPGVRVLAIQNGFWGELLAAWARRRGAAVVEVAFGPLEPVRVADVEAALDRGRFDVVIMVHVETNSGIVNPVSEVGRLVAPKDALFFVDTACSAGAMPVLTDEWGIDVQTTGSHKCLASVPGLAVMTLSDKAWSRLAGPSTMGTYNEFGFWWRSTMERTAVPPFTQPTTLVHALGQALVEFEGRSNEARWAAHAAAATAFMDEVRRLGFGVLLDDGPVAGVRSAYSDTVMAISYPEGVSDQAFRDMMLREFGIFVIGNVGGFSGKSFRVGLMSATQLSRANIDRTLASIDACRSQLVRT